MKTEPRARKRNRQAKPEQTALSQTVTRAIAILRAFSREKTELGVTELSAQLDLSKTIVFRLAQTLMKYDLLERDAGSARYRIGFGAFEIGLLFRKAALDREAEPHMRALVKKTGLTSQ